MKLFATRAMLFTFCVMLCVGIIVAFFIQTQTNKNPSHAQTLAQEVEVCNKASINQKFSCYRGVLEQSLDNTGNQPLQVFLKNLADNRDLAFRQEDSLASDPSYAIFGTNCHTFYHALGDFIAMKQEAGLLKDKVGLCSAMCTGGCYMGLYKRTALQKEFATETLKELYPLCPGTSKHQCAHEIGHILHDKYVSSILGVIDRVSEQEYGLSQKKEYSYTLYAEPNLSQPFEDCKALVPETELAYCYTGVGHNLFLFAQFGDGGYEKAFADCARLDTEMRGDCNNFLVYRIGINDAGVKFLSRDFDAGKDVCTAIVRLAGTENVLPHCYRGIGAGIGLFLESELTNQPSTTEGMSKTKQMVSDYINLCKASDQAYKEECYQGILGTRVKKMYIDFELKNPAVEALLKKVEDGFEAVG